ncbi:MAG: ABC transporter permease [Eubacteriaceae bacterium]|nr:ABC transporter permease [Eubacteriaceae bacterium]
MFNAIIPKLCRLRKEGKLSILLLAISFLAIVAIAFAAPLLFPIDLAKVSLGDRLANPRFVDSDSPYLLGTDSLGRDILIRIIYATRTSLAISMTGMFFSLVLGVFLGAVAGMFGGIADIVVMFLIECRQAIPMMLIGIVLASTIGPGSFSIILTIIISCWSGIARITRGQVIQLRQSKYIESSRLFGASNIDIIFKHVLKNIASVVIVEGTLSLAGCILLESSLSFLGLGIQPPLTSLGIMVNNGRDYLISQWWLAIMPSLVIVLLSLQVSLIGDWLRDRMDPKLRHASGR